MADETGGKKEEKPGAQQMKLRLKVDDALAGGEYANIIAVNHSEGEFVIDTFFHEPRLSMARMKHRVIMSPRNAKRLAMMLNASVERWEQQWGKIDLTQKGSDFKLVH
ncbi:DUF3467 domain-containing protein [bacterium]|nr:DUF3467 domain-containing protein [bacterium]